MIGLNMAETIRTARRQRGYTQEQLARALGLTPAAVSKWETDQALPDIGVLAPLAAALGTTTDNLLGYSPDLDESQAEELLAPARAAVDAHNTQQAASLCERVLRSYPASVTVAFACASVLMEAAQADSGEASAAALIRSIELFERCRQEGSAEQREAAAFVLAGQYVLAGNCKRALEAARSIPAPIADPRLMEITALAAGGELDQAEELALSVLHEKEEDVARLRNVLEGIERKRNAR